MISLAPCVIIQKAAESDDGKDANLLLVTSEDLEKAKLKVRPSAMREV
jgi:hypothetical protein